jgi:Tfp pilus assembly protein PilX
MSIFNTIYDIRYTKYAKGAALLLTLIVMITLTSVVGAYLGFVQGSARSTGAQISDRQAIYLAEAGLQKAVWNLMRTVANGGQGENWTTAGTTESLGDGSYTMEVQKWDWALAANNSTASSNSEVVGFEAAKAIDDNVATYWESNGKPQFSNPKNLTIAFP